MLVFSGLTSFGQRTENPYVGGSNPLLPIKKAGFAAKSSKSLRGSDPDLQIVVERWPDLSLELRQAIARMVEKR